MDNSLLVTTVVCKSGIDCLDGRNISFLLLSLLFCNYVLKIFDSHRYEYFCSSRASRSLLQRERKATGIDICTGRGSYS